MLSTSTAKGGNVHLNAVPIFDGVDHPEDLCLLTDGRIAFGGERGQLYIGEPSTGKFRKVGSTGGRILGVAVTSDDVLYACDSSRRELISLDLKSGDMGVVTSGSKDHSLRHPNSIALTATGGAFLSDSGAWDGSDGMILFVDVAGVTNVASTEFSAFANGVAISPDGKYLYVVESQFGLSRAEIGPDGTLGRREEIVALPGTVGDGLAFTADGAVVLACFQPNALLHIDAAGTLSTLVNDTSGVYLTLPTNVAFFGDGLTNVAIANLGSRSVVRLHLGIVGSQIERPASGPRRRAKT
jgi:sugar lactone lactonase YvrE